MKFENNWKQKNLENLENSFWGEPKFHSNLVITCHKLRKKPLNEFTTGDLRIMISQNFSLDYLIPLALEKLEENILIEGDCYEGDLLLIVLGSDKNFWKENKELWGKVFDLYNENKRYIDDYCYQNESKDIWFSEFEKFEKIN